MRKKAIVVVSIAVLMAAAVLAAVVLADKWGKGDQYAAETSDIADQFPIEAEPAGENPQLAISDGPYAVVHTTAGDVTILLYPDQAPKAAANFIGLARSGYYDGSSFYYAKRDELVQGGRPAALDAFMSTEAAAKGEAPPEDAAERSLWGEPFEDEFDDGLHHFPGAVGMAGAINGPDQNLSQFYFLVEEKRAEDERVIPANLYMNELIHLRMEELNEKSRQTAMDQEDIQKFEDDLNAEIQRIGTDGVPKDYLDKYTPAIEQYQKTGGAWSLDYKYTVFGQIVKGLNVAEAMSRVKVEASSRKPKKPILIESIEILDTWEDPDV